MIRILLVDDQAIIREALKVLLEQQQDFEIVGTATNGQGAIDQVETLKPDILLIDILMPGMDGITATQIIHQRFPETKIIVLSGHDDETYLANALQAGAKGYLIKNTAAEDLGNTIRSVYRGHSQLGPGLVEKIMARMNASESPNTATLPQALPQSAQSSLAQTARAQSQDPFRVVPGDLPVGIPEPEFLLLLNGFDAEALTDFVNQVLEQGTESSVLTRLGRHLKETPNSLAALYLTGSLLSKAEGRQKTALQYLKFGFKEGLRQKLSQSELLLFYQKGMLLQPDSTFEWLTQSGSPWNSEAGWSFLFSEAIEHFGEDSMQYRSLVVLRQIRATQTMARVCTSLNSRLASLQQGFERLNSIMEL
jgi:DNA-binding NarL/FixJ family response regulator